MISHGCRGGCRHRPGIDVYGRRRPPLFPVLRIRSSKKTALDGRRRAPRVVLLGIPTRGVILANRLAAHIGEFSGIDVGHGALDITLYRDDLMQKPAPARWEVTSIPARWHRRCAGDSRRRRAVFRSLGARSALDALRDVGRPRAVQLAVLVDRGHRELLVRARTTWVRMCRPSRNESVHVQLREHDDRDGVVISRDGDE